MFVQITYVSKLKFISILILVCYFTKPTVAQFELRLFSSVGMSSLKVDDLGRFDSRNFKSDVSNSFGIDLIVKIKKHLYLNGRVSFAQIRGKHKNIRAEYEDGIFIRMVNYQTVSIASNLLIVDQQFILHGDKFNIGIGPSFMYLTDKKLDVTNELTGAKVEVNALINNQYLISETHLGLQLGIEFKLNKKANLMLNYSTSLKNIDKKNSENFAKLSQATLGMNYKLIEY